MIIANSKQAHCGRVIQGNLTRAIPVLAVDEVAIVKPLAVGIISDLLPIAKPEQRTRLRRSLNPYVSRTTYLMALAERGSMRHDIEGNEVAEVSDDQRISARWRLQERRKFGANPVDWAKSAGVTSPADIVALLAIPMRAATKAFRKRRAAD